MRGDVGLLYLGVGGPGGGVALGVVHDGAVGADDALHRSHLVARPARGSALGSKRERERERGGGGVSQREKNGRKRPEEDLTVQLR